MPYTILQIVIYRITYRLFCIKGSKEIEFKGSKITTSNTMQYIQYI